MINTTQQRAYRFIRGYIQSNKEAPTFREIGEYFKFSAPSTIHEIVTALERHGLIERIPNISRGIRLK